MAQPVDLPTPKPAHGSCLDAVDAGALADVTGHSCCLVLREGLERA